MAPSCPFPQAPGEILSLDCRGLSTLPFLPDCAADAETGAVKTQDLIACAAGRVACYATSPTPNARDRIWMIIQTRNIVTMVWLR